MPIVTPHRMDGARLRELRIRRELSQGDLARLCTAAGCSVDQSQISRLEAGLNQPFTQLLRTLAAALEIEVHELFEVTK